MKVGVSIENDIQRASTIRDVIGWENDLVCAPRTVFKLSSGIFGDKFYFLLIIVLQYIKKTYTRIIYLMDQFVYKTSFVVY